MPPGTGLRPGARYSSRPFIRKTSLKLGELQTAWPRPKTKTKTGEGGAGRRDPARTGAVPLQRGQRAPPPVAHGGRCREAAPPESGFPAGAGGGEGSLRHSPTPVPIPASHLCLPGPRNAAWPGGRASVGASCSRLPGAARRPRGPFTFLRPRGARPSGCGRLGPSPSSSSAPRFSRRPRSAPGSQTAMGAPPRGVAPPARRPPARQPWGPPSLVRQDSSRPSCALHLPPRGRAAFTDTFSTGQARAPQRPFVLEVGLTNRNKARRPSGRTSAKEGLPALATSAPFLPPHLKGENQETSILLSDNADHEAMLNHLVSHLCACVTHAAHTAVLGKPSLARSLGPVTQHRWCPHRQFPCHQGQSLSESHAHFWPKFDLGQPVRKARLETSLGVPAEPSQ